MSWGASCLGVALVLKFAFPPSSELHYHVAPLFTLSRSLLGVERLWGLLKYCLNSFSSEFLMILLVLQLRYGLSPGFAQFGRVE